MKRRAGKKQTDLTQSIERLPASEGGCWEWTGFMAGRMPKAYLGKRAELGSVHKYLFQYVYGEVPQGMYCGRECGNDYCVNPEHMRVYAAKHGTVQQEVVAEVDWLGHQRR